MKATVYFEVARAASKGMDVPDTQTLDLFAQAAKEGDPQAQLGMKQIAESLGKSE